MGTIASQITSLTIVYSTVHSDADQRKHQISVSLAFVRGIHRGPVNSPHKLSVTRKMFPLDDVIMLHQVIDMMIEELDLLSIIRHSGCQKGFPTYRSLKYTMNNMYNSKQQWWFSDLTFCCHLFLFGFVEMKKKTYGNKDKEETAKGCVWKQCRL